MRTIPRLALACLIVAACGGPNDPGPRTRYLAECSSTSGPTGSDSVTANNAGSATLQLRGAGGQHILQVPEGAARPGTVFILTALPAPRVGVEARVRGQDTYTFLDRRRATLRLSAQHCTAAEFGKLASPAVLRVERDNSLTPVSSRQEPNATQVLTAELPSLSGYAIGSN